MLNLKAPKPEVNEMNGLTVLVVVALTLIGGVWLASEVSAAIAPLSAALTVR